MSSTTSTRRMEENEAVFRRYNEQVQQSLEIIKIVALAEQEPSLNHNDSPLQYFCECSDETCRERIALQPSQYARMHEERDHFVVIPHHQVEKIEKVISKKPEYWVVEKYNTPSESATGLKPTDLNNQ